MHLSFLFLSFLLRCSSSPYFSHKDCPSNSVATTRGCTLSSVKRGAGPYLIFRLSLKYCCNGDLVQGNVVSLLVFQENILLLCNREAKEDIKREAYTIKSVVLRHGKEEGLQASFHYLSRVSGLNAIGTTDLSWQGPAVMGGSIPASNQAPIPSYCYHVSYPFPGFSGPWGPTSWWGRRPPSLPPWTYSSPGAFAYDSSLQPPMASSSATSSENFQRGIIKPPTELSLKHHQLWAAQSAENVQLWVVVELADCKSRLMKLESEVLSLKSKVEEPTGHGTGTFLAGKSSKRGRPKEQISSVDRGASLSSTESEAFGGKNGASFNLVGSINGKMFEWNSGTQSAVCGRDLINVKSEQYYDDVESGKDEDDDEEMDDDGSSSAEDIA
ncbi:hypothetical protein Vadar_015498 [Vaccinium darrowii]|uniref:Uncharacterized protein n=1 Tax=Vaccinium darrowii TaxID=229202 RepID=A0ACB7YFY8_9ERIC|nr:hypothetical protein Vadar_015498 [Vaccinium darrowii]